MRIVNGLPGLLSAVCVGLLATAAHAQTEPEMSKLGQFWTETYEQAVAPQANLVGHPPFQRYEWKRIAKAQPDECYYGIGDPRNVQSFYANYPLDLSQVQIEQCELDGGQPKVNQAYVWGLTKTLGRVWWGTLANTHCLVFSSFYGPDSPFPPMETDSFVCEMDAQKQGDFRPPRIFVWDTITQTQTELTSAVLTAGPADQQRLMSTIGLRSAGSFDGVVIFGGVGFGGVNMFAFDAQTMAYLGSETFEDFENIRQWRVITNHLYVGVGVHGGGEVLRWTGDVTDPFSFEYVGHLQGDPAYITWHDGRIFATTWGGPPGTGGVLLYMSPLKGADGLLDESDADGWQVVWKISDYEVEPAAVQGGGAVKSFNGWLYWGTMDVPGTGVYAFSRIYPDEPLGIDTHLGTYRPITIFRGRNLGQPNQEIQLLYGSSLLPKYDLAAHAWTLVPNNMGGVAPRYGLAGFNNYFNNYTWWMEVYDDNLFVGTMDHLYLIADAIGSELPIKVPEKLQELATHFYGADLWRFPRGDHPAVPVNLAGMGNYSSYGIRTMVVGPYSLFLGMANPMNLLTDPYDDKPEGGWELLEFKTRPDGDKDGIPDDEDACPAYAQDDIGDPCCSDEDHDGVEDRKDACPFEPNDGIGDPCCHDEDGDGVTDEKDACPFLAVHSVGDPCDPDDDKDGVVDALDACPLDPNDKVGDPCNHDEDGDGTADDVDACPLDPNDAVGDPCNHDEDGDAVADAEDACPFDPNDSVGDACLHDEDSDGVEDALDACPLDPNDAVGDPCNHDEDGDSVADAVDACPFDANDGVGDPCNHDEDGDGEADDVDACPLDPNDAVGDPCNHDEDGDGVADAVDACPTHGSSNPDGCPTGPSEQTKPADEASAPVGCSTTGRSAGALPALLLLGLLLTWRHRR